MVHPFRSHKRAYETHSGYLYMHAVLFVCTLLGCVFISWATYECECPHVDMAIYVWEKCGAYTYTDWTAVWQGLVKHFPTNRHTHNICIPPFFPFLCGVCISHSFLCFKCLLALVFFSTANRNEAELLARSMVMTMIFFCSRNVLIIDAWQCVE